MVKSVSQVTKEKPEGLEYEKAEFDEFDQARYTIKVVKNKKGKVKQLRFSCRAYPLQGYANHEELNVNLLRLVRYTNIEIYWIRQGWNGTGYFPICSTKLQLDEEFFNFVVADSNVKAVVLRLFGELKHAIEKSGEDNECFYSTYYFPV